LNIVSSGNVPEFTLTLKDKKQEHFAVEYRGYIKVPADTIYTFYLNSDDGSMLYIDNTLLINNDGLHSDREINGSTALAAGYHKIILKYLQGSGGSNLKVYVETENINKMIIPQSWLFN